MPHLRCRGRTLPVGERTLLMGIVNVTPDSFSDGGQFVRPEHAIAHGLHLAAEGADILDVGGESTRPGAAPVPIEEELRRVVPVVRELAQRTDALISVDTMKRPVAEAALSAGAHLVNDVSGLTVSPDMAEAAAHHGAGLVIMHMQGDPQTMQHEPKYDDVVAEVRAFLAERARRAEAAGVPREALILDPGIGFGKGPEHNRALLANLDAIRSLGYPVLLGASRKSFIGRLTARSPDAPPPPATDRLEGSLAAAVAGVARGVDIVRVHDVAATWRALRVADWILRPSPSTPR